jgi:nucleoside-diphosphate-sugar epimerase
MRVATGALGKRLVPALIAHGHQVTATTRSADKVDGLRALGAVARAVPDAIVNQMTSLAGTRDLRCAAAKPSRDGLSYGYDTT